jgi:anthranilate phosphoribosyltransferase
MDYSKIIKEVGRGKITPATWMWIRPARSTRGCLTARCLSWSWAAFLIALRIKGEGEAEMKGFYEAMQQHTCADAAGRQTDADCDPQL